MRRPGTNTNPSSKTLVLFSSVDSEPVDMAEEEGDGEGGNLPRATDEAPRLVAFSLRLRSPRPICALPCFPPPSHRPPRRARRVSAPGSHRPLHEGQN